MKRKLLSVILCTALSLGGVACGAAGESVQESSAESKTVETPAENQNEGKEEAKEEVKEETKVAKELNGSQRAVIVGQDWGPAVTKTMVKLDEKVKADSVSADDFKVVETKEMFNWAALAEGSTEDPTKHVEYSFDRTVVDAYTCDENGEKAADSEYVAVELSYNPVHLSVMISLREITQSVTLITLQLLLQMVQHLLQNQGMILLELQ